jgi:hypothetical protein
MEGVGVKLRRAFGFGDAGPFDREPGRRTCTVALSWNTSSTRDCSAAQLLLDPLVEARDVDDDALVRAAPDRLLLVVSLDLKYECAAVDPDQFGRRANAHSDRRGGEMPDIEMDAEALMTIREEVLDRRERRCLDQIDHDRSGEHGHASAADPGGGVFGADQQICRSLHPDLQMRQIDHRELPMQAPRSGRGKAILFQTPCGSSTNVLGHAAGRMSANPDSGFFTLRKCAGLSNMSFAQVPRHCGPIALADDQMKMECGPQGSFGDVADERGDFDLFAHRNLKIILFVPIEVHQHDVA